jgi:N-methylhydantoinase B
MRDKSYDPTTDPNSLSHNIDPITVEVVHHTVTSICDEMEANLTRTAFSTIVYESKDFSAALLDLNGHIIAQARGSLPVFLCDLGLAVKDVFRLYARDEIYPGDIFASNDPSVFGQHLNNVVLTQPIFKDNVLIAFVAVRAHWIDIGGRDAGGWNLDTTEIYQEGIQIPTVKLFNRGHLDQEKWRLIALNIRLPEQVFGDMQAQVSACKLAERRYLDLVGKYGTDVVTSCIEEFWNQSEKRMREGVAKIPDGTYAAESFLDEDGVHKDMPVPLRVKVIVKGTDVTVDYSDLSPQVQGPINSGGVSGLAVARIAIKSLIVPVDPADEGSFRPIHVILPPGKLVSAARPAAIAQWSAALASLIDTIFKALNCAIPDKVPAGSRNDVGGIQIYGRGAEKFWYYHQACPGGWGALSTSDGPCGLKSLNHGDSYVIPTEVIESRSPIRIEREELRQDSGGAGKFRGGLGTRRVFRVLKNGVGNLTMHRGNFPPWGLAGGKPGAPDTFVVELPGQQEFQLTRAKDISLPAGSRVTVLTAGGGGWGDPLERDSRAIEADLIRGYISREKAIEDYGVSQDPATGTCCKRQGTAAIGENEAPLT